MSFGDRVVRMSDSSRRCEMQSWHYLLIQPLVTKTKFSSAIHSESDRMRSWGKTQGCMFCGEPDETRDRLYFACPYSFTVWLRVGGGLLADQASPDWIDTLNFLHLGGRNLMDQILLCMMFQTTVYYLWQERNTRRHEGPWIPHEQT
ncbi:uncharacterized protein LOC106350104 [Brassica napus]|uniref:uncharacterized protein LOC106350104 n=1 Tax=Brassica napus TaxID=3708 RepID=UPI0006AB3FCD|nr:uncharacterized protein LOC106350104 [Brassica napus]